MSYFSMLKDIFLGKEKYKIYNFEEGIRKKQHVPDRYFLLSKYPIVMEYNLNDTEKIKLQKAMEYSIMTNRGEESLKNSLFLKDNWEKIQELKLSIQKRMNKFGLLESKRYLIRFASSVVSHHPVKNADEAVRQIIISKNALMSLRFGERVIYFLFYYEDWDEKRVLHLHIENGNIFKVQCFDRYFNNENIIVIVEKLNKYINSIHESIQRYIHAIGFMCKFYFLEDGNFELIAIKPSDLETQKTCEEIEICLYKNLVTINEIRVI